MRRHPDCTSAVHAGAEGAWSTFMIPLILKRAPIGDNQDDYDVLENGVVVGRIFTVPTAPPGRSWMWASGHSAATIKRAAHGYEATREAAMAAFAKSWRRQ